MRSCPRCLAEVRAEAQRYCPHCGASLASAEAGGIRQRDPQLREPAWPVDQALSWHIQSRVRSEALARLDADRGERIGALLTAGGFQAARRPALWLAGKVLLLMALAAGYLAAAANQMPYLHSTHSQRMGRIMRLEAVEYAPVSSVVEMDLLRERMPRFESWRTLYQRVSPPTTLPQRAIHLSPGEGFHPSVERGEDYAVVVNHADGRQDLYVAVEIAAESGRYAAAGWGLYIGVTSVWLLWSSVRWHVFVSRLLRHARGEAQALVIARGRPDDAEHVDAAVRRAQRWTRWLAVKLNLLVAPMLVWPALAFMLLRLHYAWERRTGIRAALGLPAESAAPVPAGVDGTATQEGPQHG